MRVGTRSFWASQILGWGGYVLIMWLSSIPMLMDRSTPAVLDLLRFKALMGGTGLITSVALFALFAGLLPRKPSIAALSIVAAGASLVLGVVWAFLMRVLMQPGAKVTADFLKGATSYGITLLAWSALYLTFTYRRQLEAETERALRATALASEAQLQMLRYQVNPHFLFNALNSIRALIDEDKDRARQMVTELSELFRYSLLNARASEVPLGDEVDAIESYLAIQKIRFEANLDVSMQVDGGAREARLPGFLIHPLVENAVKHGMETSPMPLRIALRAERSGELLRVEVANTGRWKEPGVPCEAAGTGTGLANVRARLVQLFPGRHSIDIAEKDGWVRAVVELRLEERAA